MKKVTKSTIKSFVRKNEGKLHIMSKSDFDSLMDGRRSTGEIAFRLAEKAMYYSDHNLGYKGIWLVDGSRNIFSPFENDEFIGYEVYNCCAKFIIGVKK